MNICTISEISCAHLPQERGVGSAFARQIDFTRSYSPTVTLIFYFLSLRMILFLGDKLVTL